MAEDALVSGGPAMTGGTMAYTDQDMAANLETYILGARPKPRLSEEERLEREMTRRRNLELERRGRIFDAKRRTIGLDIETIDAQLAEKARQKALDDKQQHADDGQAAKIDRQLKLMENQKQQAKKLMEKESREFSMTYLSRDQAREFDLNDPQAKKKSLPSRVGDDDPRCGPSSMQQFSGEDLNKPERVRQQRLATTAWIEQQKFEKAMRGKLEADNGGALAGEASQITDLRNSVEQQEKDLRRELQREQQGVNQDMASNRRNQLQMDQANRAVADASEISFHSNDTFLNETAPSHLDCGRIRRDAYKGSTQEERIQTRGQLEMQAQENAGKRFGERCDDHMFNAQTEATRRQLVAMEREKQRNRRQKAVEMSQHNQQMREDQHTEKRKLSTDVYNNAPTVAFFEQFGKGTR